MTMGMIEELNESDARKLMDTNFWSSLGLSGSDALFGGRSVLDISYRLQALALLSRVRCPGIYSASKFALEGMKIEALAKKWNISE